MQGWENGKVDDRHIGKASAMIAPRPQLFRKSKIQNLNDCGKYVILVALGEFLGTGKAFQRLTELSRYSSSQRHTSKGRLQEDSYNLDEN